MNTATAATTVPPRLRHAPSQGESSRLAGIVLAALLISNLPLFLCMPLTADTVYYDMQARTVLDGGVLYRDLFEPNLPGIVWGHVGLRSVLGWSSEALRLADVLFFTVSVCLLVSWVRYARRPPSLNRPLHNGGSHAVWVAVLLSWFYFSISEWCHCQRDMWMLLPALGALALRRRQMHRLGESEGEVRAVFAWSSLEGLCWGAAFWIKPHVAVPGAACWLFSALQAHDRRRVVVDLLGLLTGGLAAGAAGVTWMVVSATWPHFLEVFLEWNPDYVASGRERWSLSRLEAMGRRLFPWILVHLVAVPLAGLVILKSLRARWKAGSQSPMSRKRAVYALFATFYLGWTIQAFFIQHLFDYVHAPGVVLAITFLAGCSRWLRRVRLWKPSLVAFVITAALVSPAPRPDRLSCWWTCVTEGSTPEIRDRLSDFAFPDSVNLQRVADFLNRQHLHDGELTCYTNSVIYLYPQLNLQPPTRFAFPAELITLFPHRKEQISSTVASSPQRFVVTDLAMILSLQHPEAVSPEGPLALPPGFPSELKDERPWCYPIVFRAGRYLVHRVVSQQPNRGSNRVSASEEGPSKRSAALRGVGEAESESYPSLNCK